MRDIKEKIFEYIMKIITMMSILILVFVLVFIFKESIAFFKETSVIKFITGMDWNPLSKETDLSILPIILGTIYVSVVAIAIALPIGVGTAIALSSYIGKTGKIIVDAALNLLVGIPSVVYGFIGLVVLIGFLERNFKMSSGESVLAGGIVLAIMILPYIITTCRESMDKINKNHSRSSNALGVSKSYMIRNILIPESKTSILAGTILALSRALGETMAVMMVIGNSPIITKLLGRSQTIPSLIALEMGMAEVGSTHYHALFASGFVLMILLLIINIIFYFIKRNIKI